MVTFDKTQSCNTDTHCLASLLDELYVKWPFKVKKELTPPLPIMMVINIDMRHVIYHCYLDRLKKVFCVFLYMMDKNVLLCLRQNDPVLSRCAPDHFGARENTFLDFPSRQHIISYTMYAVYYFTYQVRQYIISNTKYAVYYFIIRYLPDIIQ